MAIALTPAQTWLHQRKNSWIEASGLTLPPEIVSIISEYRVFVPTLKKVQAVFEHWPLPLLQWVFTEVFRKPTEDPVGAYFDCPAITTLSLHSLPTATRAHMGNTPFPGDMVDSAEHSHPIMRWEEDGKPKIAIHLFQAVTRLHHSHWCHIFSTAEGNIAWTQTSEVRIFSNPHTFMLWFQKVHFSPSRSGRDLYYEDLLCPKNKYQLIPAETYRPLVPLSAELLHWSNTVGLVKKNGVYAESQQQNECVCDIPIQLTDRLVFTESSPKKRKADTE